MMGIGGAREQSERKTEGKHSVRAEIERVKERGESVERNWSKEKEGKGERRGGERGEEVEGGSRTRGEGEGVE